MFSATPAYATQTDERQVCSTCTHFSVAHYVIGEFYGQQPKDRYQSKEEEKCKKNSEQWLSQVAGMINLTGHVLWFILCFESTWRYIIHNYLFIYVCNIYPSLYLYNI